jgi:uncharacterized protein YciI
VSAPVVGRYDSLVFAFLCRDGPDADALRTEHLQPHLAYAAAHWRDYVAAGPLKQGGEVRGSLFLVRAPDEAEALRLMAGDPYMSCGLYASVEVSEFTPAAGRLIGGRIWSDPG